MSGRPMPRRLASLAGVSLAATATVVFAAGPAAAAGVDSFAYTDPSKYGYALYFSGPERMDVCDTDVDGYSVQGRIWSKSDKSDMVRELDGGDSGCDSVSFNRAAGTVIYMQACRYSSGSSTPFDCGTVSSKGRAS
ncbi:hypothetical protein [Streptomyces sp. NPDC002851]